MTVKRTDDRLVHKAEALRRRMEQQDLERAEAAARQRAAEQAEIELVTNRRREIYRMSRENPKEGLVTAIALLHKSCTAEREFDTAIQCLLSMVGNVVSYPEDPRFKRLRVNNEHFQDEIGKFEGGIECFIAKFQ